MGLDSPSSSAGTSGRHLLSDGGGTGLIGMWKAFAELEAIGFIGSKRPRMVAVQARAAPQWCGRGRRASSTPPRWEDVRTDAAGIRVPQAVGDFLILRAVRESNGFAIAVDDEAIKAGSTRSRARKAS